MTFELSKEDWYKLRDNRTNILITEKLGKEFSLGICVDEQISESYALQCMTLLACNNLARWCRKITISMKDCNQRLIFEENLKEFLNEILGKVDPHGNFIFKDFDEDEYDIILCIGAPKKSLSKPFYWIDGSGWIGGCGYGKHVNIKRVEDKNPIGPSIAAWLGSALIFNTVTGNKVLSDFSEYYSMYDYGINRNYSELSNPSIPNSIDIGNVCQIGCGAVGSSFDYLLGLTEFNGKISLIDYDQIEYENCNNTPGFSAFDKGLNKVDICKNHLNKKFIQVTTIAKSYEEFTRESEFKKYNPDVLLCFANEKNVWTSIQHIIPPIVLSASTTPNWAVSFGRHIPFQEWCLVCAYYHQIDKTFVGQCGAGEILVNKETIVGNLPFLAPCAATFVLAELVRLNLKIKNKINNVYWILKPPFITQFESSGPRKNCMCQNQYKVIYNELRKDTKFCSQ